MSFAWLLSQWSPTQQLMATPQWLHQLPDDVWYVLLLTLSAGTAVVFRHGFLATTFNVPMRHYRRYLTTASGFLLTVAVFGRHSYHPLLICLLNALIIRRLHHNGLLMSVLSMCATLGYLAALRLASLLNWQHLSAIENMLQMIITLRLIGMAYEVRQSLATLKTSTSTGSTSQNIRKQDNLVEETSVATVLPSVGEIVNYTFCHLGLICGPYYTYKTYVSCMDGRYWHTGQVCGLVWRRARILPLYAAVFIILQHLWPQELIENASTSGAPWWQNLWLIYPLFAIYRMRMYSAFILCELVLMSHGMGLYPVWARARPGRGPTVSESPGPRALTHTRKGDNFESLDFGCIYNIAELDVELDTSMTCVLKKWNMTVQYWLYHCVYGQLTGSKTFRALVTMSVSAFWHGIHAGYYLSLMTCPLYMLVEHKSSSLVKDRFSSAKGVCECVSWVVRVFMFSYLCVGFCLPDTTSILAYWRCVYYCGHLLVVFLLMLCWLIAKFSAPTSAATISASSARKSASAISSASNEKKEA